MTSRRFPPVASGYPFPEQERETLAALGQPTYEIPLISDAAELSGLHEIAQRLQAQGMV